MGLYVLRTESLKMAFPVIILRMRSRMKGAVGEIQRGKDLDAEVPRTDTCFFDEILQLIGRNPGKKR